MKNQTTGIWLSAALVATIAIAASAVPATAVAEWTGDIEGGTVVQGDSKGTKLRFKMGNSERPLNQQFYADWIRPDSGGNSYKVGYEPQYWFSDNTYVFGDASWLTQKAESDQISIDQQTNVFAGVGLQMINTATRNLYAEVGAGQTNTKYSSTALADLESQKTVARIGASQILTDYLKLELEGDYSTSDEIDITAAEAAVALRVAGGAIKYTYRAISSDRPGLPKDDATDSSISYSYNF